jgi:hypothetical protein
MQDFLDALGIKGSILVAGLAGGALRALSHRRFKFREMVASPICGALAAGYLTVPTLHCMLLELVVRRLKWQADR